ncbi:hypothetical protein BDW60DRAFT_24284 [Aspergillus nidulans var. acristatus]
MKTQPDSLRQLNSLTIIDRLIIQKLRWSTSQSPQKSDPTLFFLIISTIHQKSSFWATFFFFPILFLSHSPPSSLASLPFAVCFLLLDSRLSFSFWSWIRVFCPHLQRHDFSASPSPPFRTPPPLPPALRLWHPEPASRP